jgi:hypothetical protein
MSCVEEGDIELAVLYLQHMDEHPTFLQKKQVEDSFLIPLNMKGTVVGDPTPLKLAIVNNRPEMIELLLTYDLDRKITNGDLKCMFDCMFFTLFFL